MVVESKKDPADAKKGTLLAFGMREIPGTSFVVILPLYNAYQIILKAASGAANSKSLGFVQDLSCDSTLIFELGLEHQEGYVQSSRGRKPKGCIHSGSLNFWIRHSQQYMLKAGKSTPNRSQSI